MMRITNMFAGCVFAALLALTVTGALANAKSLKQYSKILVTTGLEDTTSEFYSIYFYDKRRKLVRVIEMWNGGCCQAPSADDFTVNGKQSTYVRSYILETKAKTMVHDVLCKRLSTLKTVDPPKPVLDDLKTLLSEAVPFDGCR